MARAAISLSFETTRFKRFTEELVKELTREEAEIALRAIALEAVKKFIKRTPKDTGRAAAGWMVYALSTGVPISFDDVPNADPQAIAQGLREGSFGTGFVGERPFLRITNGVPYIMILEFGGSGQAPAGMVRISMRELSSDRTVDKAWETAMSKGIRKADKRAGRNRRRRRAA